VLRDQPLLAAISAASRANIECELAKWDIGIFGSVENWVKTLIEAKRDSGESADENAITTAMLWALWETSKTPARIMPLKDGPTNLLGIFQGSSSNGQKDIVIDR